MKSLILGTAMAVGFASYVGAAEVKQDATMTKPPVGASKVMSETDMDKVTAGSANGTTEMCNGQICRWVGTGGQSWHRASNNGRATFYQ